MIMTNHPTAGSDRYESRGDAARPALSGPP